MHVNRQRDYSPSTWRPRKSPVSGTVTLRRPRSWWAEVTWTPAPPCSASGLTLLSDDLVCLSLSLRRLTELEVNHVYALTVFFIYFITSKVCVFCIAYFNVCTKKLLVWNKRNARVFSFLPSCRITEVFHWDIDQRVIPTVTLRQTK